MKEPKLHGGRQVLVFKGYNNLHYTLEYQEIIDGEWKTVRVERLLDYHDVGGALGTYLGQPDA